ncbi:GNAT family N-acetyltransferase [Brevundimonas vesicularis]|uniref:GNAT family N-acetyltransferase n=1 Tax=Brevundimonas vesicularis TaxID=41276 RepID=UPI0038D502DE
MTAMDLRPAAAADIPPLHALIERAYRGNAARQGWTHEADLLDGQRTDPEALAEILADPARVILVAQAQDGLIGCVQIADMGGGLSYLGLLSVDPARQAGGLGRRLVEAAENEARARFSATRMEMTVIRQRTELIAWYQRRDYALTGEARPFPMNEPRFGLPKAELSFVVLEKAL